MHKNYIHIKIKCMYIIQSKVLPINKTNNNRHVICQLHSMQIQKEVKSNIKQPSCKKSVQPPRMLLCKKMWNPKWRPRNDCDGRLNAKILIMIIQVNLVLNHSEMWRRQHRFTWIVVIKIFVFSLPSQPLLGCHFGFHIFFHNSILGPHTFLQLGCFGLDINYSIFKRAAIVSNHL